MNAAKAGVQVKTLMTMVRVFLATITSIGLAYTTALRWQITNGGFVYA
jgi:hypothetical protein